MGRHCSAVVKIYQYLSRKQRGQVWALQTFAESKMEAMARMYKACHARRLTTDVALHVVVVGFNIVLAVGLVSNEQGLRSGEEVWNTRLENGGNKVRLLRRNCRKRLRCRFSES